MGSAALAGLPASNATAIATRHHRRNITTSLGSIFLVCIRIERLEAFGKLGLDEIHMRDDSGPRAVGRAPAHRLVDIGVVAPDQLLLLAGGNVTLEPIK